MDRLKIGLISTPFFGVPPPKYGGLERVVYDLWDGLLKRGHKVICFSPNPTITPRDGFHVNTGEAVSTVGVDWLNSEREMLLKCEPYFSDLDIMHEHNWFGHLYAAKTRNAALKCCHTHHGHINYEWWGRSQPPFKLNLIGISKWMKHCYESGYDNKAPMKMPSEYAYNGVDMAEYSYKKDKGDSLMFLGRVDPIKAPHNALEVAELTNLSIDIVGGTSFVADPQYVTHISKRCNANEKHRFIGEVDHQTKVKYLQNAKALLIPSQFGEPFGLIAVEAMACGTVPIALRDGALPEIIEHGKSGFICDSINEMVEAVKRVETVDPSDCRKRAEQFSKERMAERYEHLYKRVSSGDEW